jgi:hypothetical protein
MIIIRCHVCGADPAGRWVQPPALIYIDEPPPDPKTHRRVDRKPEHYRCRAHVSEQKEEAIQKSERTRKPDPSQQHDET